jgi:hypothetical protein
MVMSHMIRIFDDIIVLETTVNSHWLVTVPTCLNNAAMPEVTPRTNTTRLVARPGGKEQARTYQTCLETARTPPVLHSHPPVFANASVTATAFAPPHSAQASTRTPSPGFLPHQKAQPDTSHVQCARDMQHHSLKRATGLAQGG